MRAKFFKKQEEKLYVLAAQVKENIAWYNPIKTAARRKTFADLFKS